MDCSTNDMFHMKHLVYFSILFISVFNASAYAQTAWKKLYQDRDVMVLVDERTYFDPTGKVLLWAKNITKDKFIYTQYQIQCKPKKVFKIINVNAQDKTTKAYIPIALGAVVTQMNVAPPKSPAEYIVNSVCGQKK